MKEDKPSRREEDSIPPADDDSTSISSGMNEALDSESIVFNRMPLLNYFRIGGSSVPGVDPGATINDTGNQEDQICMCSAMAQVMVETSGLAPSSSEGKRSASSNLGTGDNDHRHLLNSDLWKHPYHVIAFGLKDGSIEFRSAYSGALLINEERFTIPGVQSDVPPPVVDISFDSTGTAMVAIDLDGNVAMWEIKYSVSFQHRGTRDSHLLRSSEAPPVSHVNRKEAQKESESCLFSLPTLTVDSVSVSRSRYPNSWAKPTCITIDPANRRSREKSFITGFQDGRLVLTRRGGLFQRRNDTVVYHGTPDASESFIKYRGIECIAWRGSFVAWADANGIKLLDVQSLTRIAHIDRPSGARPSLYPSISSLQPSLVFERSHSLLISWGDCLMVIEIEDSKEPGSANKKRSVECSMAWELDCVACGVAPLDTDHVLVLGLVPVEDDAESVTVAARANDIDVQILSRADGAVVYCDSLPVLQRSNISSAVGGDVSKSGTSLKLLSSFALSKMEDSIEVEEQKRFISNAMGELDTSVLFAPDFGEAGNHVFHDAHLQWNLISAYEEEANVTYFDGETDSVDSDDYGFILRPEADLLGSKRENETPTGAPPVMVIVTPSAMIRSQTSTVDDAIAHALSRNMSALALKHGLLHKQEIRRYQTVDLVDNFLQSLLRLNKKYRGEMDAPVPTSSRPLSLRRMQIALRSMPNLLGDRVARWEKWIKKLDAIPGVIFLLRENLPVRDPVLPPLVYERVLIKMFREVEDLIHDDTESRKGLFLREEAVDHFLNSLLSWGPSSALQEYIGLYSPRNRKSRECQTLEIALRRRHFQSSKGFLSFPATTLETESDTATSEPPERSTEGAKESLYSIVNVMKIIAIHAPMLTKRGEFENGVQESEDSDRRMNSLLSFEAMGRSTKSNGAPLVQQKNPVPLTHRGRKDSLPNESPPLFALIQLVGLDRGSRFLMEHCVAPELPSLEVEFEVSSMSGTKDMVQKETLPLDLVARQLERSPPFLYWYLNMIFTEKPELYVRFPNNYIPPKTVTELHRKHLDLHVKFADGNKFSDQALLGVEKYEVNTFSTPLLSFLKAALPVGGLSALEVRRLLESHRSKEAAGSDKSLSAQKSSCFALELAFVIEHSGDQSATEAKGILDLYLDGANSLNLAVSYAQRQKDYSNLLWDELIGYCLDNVSQRREGEGLLFGALLEASAVYGADLSRLVSRIPAGMVVEGLRPRLVSAVADYRLKLDVHEAALTVSEEEKSSMQRQVAHRSKRGVRYSPIWNAKGTNGGNSDSVADPSKEDHSKAIAITKPKLRRDRYRLSYSSPMR
ncbi:unnamed protein product [Cylindrotheca closterium]|uniref:Vps41 beta-propeller domain-containing protein n=1 Tax=Cylindrotheca closterium TaxID=2856 RepID=A0AAD2FPZ0_9STRA|nr:unnamed protein product [Cylindrotheca closterium]